MVLATSYVSSSVQPTESYWSAYNQGYESTTAAPKAASPVNLVAINFVIGLTGLFGNVFVFGVIHMNRSQSPKIIENLLRHQTIIDLTTALLVTAIATLSSLASTNQQLNSNPSFHCVTLTVQTLTSTSLGASLYNLMIITLEQYFEIVHPLFHKTRLVHVKTVKVISFVWSISFSLRFTYLMSTSKVVEGNCSIRDSSAAFKISGFISLFTLVLNFIFPVIIMICCLCRMAWVMHKKTVQVSVATGTNAKTFTNARVNIMKTLAMFLVILIVCWLSIFIEYFLSVVELIDKKFFSSWIYGLNMSFLFLSCSANPLVYAIKYKKFREGFLQLLERMKMK